MSQVRIGLALKHIREVAGLGQKDIASALSVDQSRVSRIENGADPTPEEVQAWIGRCPSPAADELNSFLSTEWPPDLRPSWDHPDVKALGLAVATMGRIDRAMPDMVDILRSQLALYRLGLVEYAAYLAERSHRVAFVGPVGVGKTTAESIAAGLVVAPPIGKPTYKDVVLAVGSGRTTVCEVSIEEADRWGLVIEPETDENIKFYVDDLCSPYLKTAASAGIDDEAVRVSVPQEIARALKNMAHFTKPREKSTGTNRAGVFDPIRELAIAKGPDAPNEFLLCLKLPERTLSELWWTEEFGIAPLEWLRDTFKRVNNGNHERVTLPRRIRVVVGRSVLDDPDFHVSLLDTRGVDKHVARPDLAACLADSRTATVLCSTFVGAPDMYTTQLLQFAEETGVSGLRDRVSILVLAKNDEAREMRREEDGDAVESADEGYSIKESQVRLALQNVKPADVRVGFFNAASEDPSRVRAFVKGAIHAVREPARVRIAELASATAEILDNTAAAEIRVAQTEVVAWLNRALQQELEPGDEREEPHRRLVRKIRDSHPQTVWAMVRRRGTWPNLDVSFYIGSAAASDAQKRASDAVLRLTGVIRTLRANDSLSQASKLIDEVEHAVEQGRGALVTEIRNLATATYAPAVTSDHGLWAKCAAEWGTGKGFRDRVADHVEDWFRDPKRQSLDGLYDTRYAKVWKKTFIREVRRHVSADAPDSQDA